MTLPKPFVQAVDLKYLERRLSDAARGVPAKTRAPSGKRGDAAEAGSSSIGQESHIGGINAGCDRKAPASTVKPSLTLSKTSVQPIDLDDLEKQWLDVASAWPAEPFSPSDKSDHALADLAAMPGGTEPHPGIAGVSDHGMPATPPLLTLQDASFDMRSGPSEARRGRLEREAWITKTLRAHVPPAPVSEGRSEPLFDHDSRHDGARATTPLDGVTRAAAYQPAAPARRAPARRSVVARTARTLAAQILFVSIAGGAVALMSAYTAAERPLLAMIHAPANAGGEDPASFRPALLPAASWDEPPAAPSGQRAELVAEPPTAAASDVQPASKVASSGGDIASGSAPAGDLAAGEASAAPVTAPPAGVAPGSAPAELLTPAASPAPALSAMGSASGPAADPSTPPAPSAPANVAPDRARATAQGSATGAERPAATASVRPDETIGSNGKSEVRRPSRPTQVKPMTITSADDAGSVSTPSAAGSTIGAAKKPVLAKRAQPTAPIAADRPRAMAEKSPQPLGEADHVSRGGSDARTPSLVPPRDIPNRMITASASQAPSARPASLPTRLRPNPTGGSSMWIGLASSSSESDARATLSQLQKQFPGQLGGSSIHQVDRGGPGDLYRLRLGPLPLGAASKVCSAVRAAGKNCVLTSS
jgi:hypothetical protein